MISINESISKSLSCNNLAIWGAIMTYIITKTFKIDVAERNWKKGRAQTRGKDHYDLNDMCPEFQIHGHTLHFDISLKGHELDETGFILDTDILKNLMKEKIKALDHSFLLHKLDPLYADIEVLVEKHRIKIYATEYVISYENIARDIFLYCAKQLKQHGLEDSVSVDSVCVYSKTISGTYTESQAN